MHSGVHELRPERVQLQFSLSSRVSSRDPPCGPPPPLRNTAECWFMARAQFTYSRLEPGINNEPRQIAPNTLRAAWLMTGLLSQLERAVLGAIIPDTNWTRVYAHLHEYETFPADRFPRSLSPSRANISANIPLIVATFPLCRVIAAINISPTRKGHIHFTSLIHHRESFRWRAPSYEMTQIYNF